MDIFSDAAANPTMAYLLPFLIFLARIVDVSLGTLRIVLISRGQRLFASLLGFIEVFIWLVTISQILQNLSGVASYLAYAAGFAAGTYMGMSIERSLRVRKSIVRIVASGNTDQLTAELTERGYRLTRLSGRGAKGPVEIVFSVVDTKRLHGVLKMIKRLMPHAFYSIEDVQRAANYEAGQDPWRRHRPLLGPFHWFRKSK